jgi:hypothetical protein
MEFAELHSCGVMERRVKSLRVTFEEKKELYNVYVVMN